MPDLEISITIPEARIGAFVETFIDPQADGSDPLGRRLLGEEAFDAIVNDDTLNDNQRVRKIVRRAWRKFIKDCRHQTVACQKEVEKQQALDAEGDMTSA